ncbi:glycosyltransferase involved in cell wall biosynthesis [Anoxybacillus vitaminiphilus]|uniref:Glycosyltransferase involved in cell wall biosynthesis n=1 Tax=Paranoxybacillus vitaminiphilus TaxID=581036 RepID=A0A327YIV3_9BACL|nr:glycosyltransferase family 1 protein [Anoxybacillus vitaminiphilus]RAK20391.1 glycosyltransferase involved in cell wall biosynthesis [Anoxybacillus vitaminiphilus]
MRIGIDALYIRPGKVGGTESYLRNLLKGLEDIDQENQYYIFTTETNQETFHFSKENFNKVVCKLDGQNRFKRVFFTNTKLPKLIKNYNLDIMFFPTYIRTITKVKGTKIISNIHDLQYKHYPQYFSLLQKLVFNTFYPISVKKSDKIVAISQFVKEDILTHFPEVKSNKIKVIYNPIDFDSLDVTSETNALFQRLKLKKNSYILSVASLLPHKNLPTLVKAFSHLKGDYPDIKLVLVGVKGKSTQTIEEMIRNLGIEGNVIIPGFVTNEELSALYSNAKIYVSTSIFEGFGMPPVEAMYKKIPTITTKCASLPEVTLNKAYYYDDPFSDQQLYEKIKEILECAPDPADLMEYSKLVKGKYSNEKIAYEYLALFNDVYNS